MKSWIFHEVIDENGNHSGYSTLEDVPMVECPDDGAVLKIDCASVCGGDVDCTIHGGANHKVRDNEQWGHEMSGTIVEVGKNVTDLKVGERVWPFPKYCTVVRNARAGSLGGFSEYVMIEVAKRGYSLLPLDGISDLEGSLIEPLSVGWHAGCNAHPAPGKKGVVFGAGCIGTGAALAMKWHGCEDVVVVGRRPDRLKVMEELGFKTFTTLDEDWCDQLKEYFGFFPSFSRMAVKADCFVEATADDDIIPEVIKLMPKDANLTIVAAHEKPLTIPSGVFTFTELHIHGCGAQRDEDVAEVMEMMRSKRWNLNKIVGCLVPQTELMYGIEQMKTGKTVKSCIDYTGKYIK